MQLISDVIDRIRVDSLARSDAISAVIGRELDAILGDLLQAAEDVSGAIVSSVDGIAWAQRLEEGFDEHRFAAMSSAAVALSDNLAAEAGRGSTRNMLIETDAGNVLLMHAGDSLLLTVFTRGQAQLGMALAYGRQAAEKIACLVIEED